MIKIKRIEVENKPFSAEARDALGVDLNNFATLQIYTFGRREAWDCIEEAEQQFFEIISLFETVPAPPAFLGLAVVRYNAGVLALRTGDHETSRNMHGAAVSALEALPKDRRDADHAFVREALDELDVAISRAAVGAC